jgi:hypothetical protein
LKISELFNLNKTQSELDFIDIDPENDLPLFLEPSFLNNRNDIWSIEASHTIKDFFNCLLSYLKNNQIDEAKNIFSHLGEPNETCLGLSQGNPQGRGVGPVNTEEIFKNLLKSKAVLTGLVEDLEDCMIFVDDFGKDKLSDITTNLIRKHLIDYTIQQCELWEIPLRENTPSGDYWDASTSQWSKSFEKMLVVKNKKILLVPKSIVSFCSDYTPQKFHQHFVLNFLQNEHLKLKSGLVQKRKDGFEFVTKKSIKRESPGDKEDLRRFSLKHPVVFKRFKEENDKYKAPLKNEDIANDDVESLANFLREELITIPSGKNTADKYHNLCIGILDFLLYPDLTKPRKEQPIHDGRKRIDIAFENSASSGFFYSLHAIKKIPSSYIFVECKNYTNDPENPEFDQLAGRFSPNRGKFGILLCREVSNKSLALQRCKDALRDDRGLIVYLEDQDILEGLKSKFDPESSTLFSILESKVRDTFMF